MRERSEHFPFALPFAISASLVLRARVLKTAQSCASSVLVFFLFVTLRIVFVFVAYLFSFHRFHAIAAFPSSATGEGHLCPHHLSLDDSSIYS